MNRIAVIASKSFSPELVQRAFESLIESSEHTLEDFSARSDSFLSDLGKLLVISPPMLDTVRAHPEYLHWLETQVQQKDGKTNLYFPYQDRWNAWNTGSETNADPFELLRAFKRREYLLLSFLDISGRMSFGDIVLNLSELADWVINKVLRLSWLALSDELSDRQGETFPENGFAVIAMGKLGGRELNYSSDIDLIFCRRNPESGKEMDFFSKLGGRLIRALSKVSPEGFLYRVDMRLRPHGGTGPLVPTIDSLINYYESWAEPWERQALIKARSVAGSEAIRKRFQAFISSFTLSRQLDESALEDIKRIKHRAEREFNVEPKIHLKQGPGGIRDVEFYVQFSQLTIGWKYPEVRSENTLQAIEALARMKVLLDGEESLLSLAYIFLRIVEHRLQLHALVPQAILPDSPEDLELLARSLGFQTKAGSAAEMFLRILRRYRSRIRGILERVYVAPGYLRLNEREEELAQLLSERMPKRRVREVLSQYGFQDIDKAWQNIRLLALGPEGRLLPPGERRAFIEFAFPMLEVLRDTIDPDQALHNLEDFATATGNRISFLRTLASRRPHLSRLTNLLAHSNRCRQILSRHPEFFDSLARGLFLHEGRQTEAMYTELQERMGVSPRGEKREDVLRKYRQREMVRIAYRDLGGLADSLEVSGELSDLASACLAAAVDWTRIPYDDPARELNERLHPVALGKLGSRQMHYASDLDMVFLYDSNPDATSAEERARLQIEQDGRVEKIIELLSAVTPEGITYSIDLRLRPGGSSGTLARSWESFLEYSKQYMQPWERMALVRSRILSDSREHQNRWNSLMQSLVYEYTWSEESLESIRHIKRRIEKEINKETRNTIDFKFGKGGISDLEFLVQFLQIRHGRQYPDARTPDLAEAVIALSAAGILDAQEREILLRAHRFERLVENRYQLMEEWTSREIANESPTLVRLAGSMGYRGEAFAVRKSFLGEWDDTARSVRKLVERYFYSA